MSQADSALYNKRIPLLNIPLKVRKFKKQIILLSIIPKKERNICQILPRAEIFGSFLERIVNK